MKVAYFHFDEELSRLLPKHWRSVAPTYKFTGPQSTKHLIESLGIPHTEVGRIVVNGEPETLNYLVRDGDQVDVTIASPAKLSAEPRFVIDGHLGRLNALLRMLGMDCVYRADASDSQLSEIASAEARILLTRDHRLLMRKAVSEGYLIRSLEPHRQMREVAQHFSLTKWMRPFCRCIRCNHLLVSVAKDAIQDRLQPLTRLYFSEFRICPSCQQIYWNGSHVERMRRIISSLGPPVRED